MSLGYKGAIRESREGAERGREQKEGESERVKGSRDEGESSSSNELADDGVDDGRDDRRVRNPTPRGCGSSARMRENSLRERGSQRGRSSVRERESSVRG